MTAKRLRRVEGAEPLLLDIGDADPGGFQHRLPGFEITREQAFGALPEQFFPKRRVAARLAP